MYYALTGAIKRRVILELRRFWSYHPKYPNLPNNIQGKYRFKERPQEGIVVKTGSANRVDLSADNYIGVVRSYVYLARVSGYNGLAIEWVREDGLAIQANQGRFPSLPGVYYIELVEEDSFTVHPMLDVTDEAVLMVSASEGQTIHPYVAGTLALYEMPAGYQLVEGVNYTADPATGQINLNRALGAGQFLAADYRYRGEVGGPYPIHENFSNNKAIAGCVLAFGRRCAKGDRMAVVVQPFRNQAALEYGGRWDVQVEIDIVARDVETQEEIADQTVIYLWGIARSRLSTEGLEMTDLSMGGESEEVYDETGDDYFYNSTLSLTMQTEWKVYVPLVATLRKAIPLTVDQETIAAGLDDDQIANFEDNIRNLAALGLEPIRDPFFVGKTKHYETVG
jgi:hypothetical protein